MPSRPAVADRVTAALELRDALEVVNTPQYGAFLKAVVPPLCDVLRAPDVPGAEGAASSTSGSDTPHSRVRTALLDVLTRLPLTEVRRRTRL